MSKKVIMAALSAVVAMGIGSQATHATSTADEKSQIATKGMEKCYGIAKAGKNDCGSASEACAGQAKTDRMKGAWIAVPKGTCDKIVGGSTQEPTT